MNAKPYTVAELVDAREYFAVRIARELANDFALDLDRVTRAAREIVTLRGLIPGPTALPVLLFALMDKFGIYTE